MKLFSLYYYEKDGCASNGDIITMMATVYNCMAVKSLGYNIQTMFSNITK